MSNELFIDIHPKDGCHENRAQVGFTTDFIWDTSLTIFYQARGKKGSAGDWSNANAIGTVIGYSF